MEKKNSLLVFADFAAKTTYDTLPPELISYTRQLLLDTLGCGVAGMASDKGKWGIDFVRRCYGAPGPATVLGYGDHLGIMGAAFANAELINGLDFEPAGLHVPPYVLPPVLALAEAYHSNGREVITAAVVALEIATRIAKGLLPAPKYVENGKETGISTVFGPCSTVFGAAAGAAKLKGFDASGIAQAMGLAGVLSPVPSQASMHRDLPVNSGKYMMAGWGAQAGITAAELIQSGHRGNLHVLDSDFGYWRFTAQSGWDSEKALQDLGQTWMFMTTTPYKRFPCCGMMHGGLECLLALLSENEIKPQEIQHIHVRLDPTSSEGMFHTVVLRNQIDTQFSVRYNMALAACGIRPGLLWQDASNLNSPEVQGMMEKITTGVHPACAAAMEKDPRARIVDVEVSARGRRFYKQLEFIKGTVTAGAAMEVTQEERLQKFRDNTMLFLSAQKVEMAIRAFEHLEEAADFGAVMALLHV